MLLHSAEMRWFFARALPAAIKQGFLATGAKASPPRTDSYVVLPGCKSVGVKLREGRFEVKALCRAPRATKVSPEVAGYVDTWVKWSLRHDLLEQLAPAMRAQARFVEVGKRRLLRKFAFLDGEPVAMNEEADPDEGCHVELTAIDVEGAAWWTFGLEAFGSPELVEDQLRRTVEAVRPPCPLPLSASRSYPAWLATLRPLA